MSKYIALTIGPIHKTLISAKSTKGIWSASYLFSFLIKNIIENFCSQIDGQRDFLMPFIEYNSKGAINWAESTADGVGLLPDRFIIESGEGDFEKVKDSIETTIRYFASLMAYDLQKKFNNFNTKITVIERKKDYNKLSKDELTNKIEAFLKNYIQAYYIQVDEINKNPVLEIQDYLDNLELQSKIVEQEEYPYLWDILENCYYNFMVEREFEKDVNFPSTIEIAAKQFNISDNNFGNPVFKENVKKILDKRDDSESQEKFISKLKEKDVFPNISFKQHHKYIAVIQADGDNIGNFIKKIYEIETDKAMAKEIFRKFSYNLMAFARASVAIIKEYGGTNIYAGGDDLLFFAPVTINRSFLKVDLTRFVNKDNTGVLFDESDFNDETEKGNKTIFWLINKLDLIFSKLIADNPVLKQFSDVCKKEGKPLSLSYGVSVSYYKFPLNEALDAGNKLLFKIAKSQKEKNALSFNVLKHSGQFFGTTLLKSGEFKTYEVFEELLKQSFEDNNFLTSVMYKLDDQKVVLDEIIPFMSESDEDIAGNRLLQFFENNFDENIHKHSSKLDFLKNVRHLVSAVFNDPPGKPHKDYSLSYKMEQIYALLRFVHFIKADDKNE